MKIVKLEVLARFEADKKQDVQNFLNSHGYQLLEEELFHLSEYEDAESNEDAAVVLKLDATNLSRMFKRCVEAKTHLDENNPNYERVFACQPKTNISFALYREFWTVKSDCSTNHISRTCFVQTVEPQLIHQRHGC